MTIYEYSKSHRDTTDDVIVVKNGFVLHNLPFTWQTYIMPIFVSTLYDNNFIVAILNFDFFTRWPSFVTYLSENEWAFRQ